MSDPQGIVVRQQPMYDKIVQNESDLVGAVAYAIYKQKKQNFIKSVNAKHSREPNNDEYEGFYLSHCEEKQISDYREQAQKLFGTLVAQKMKELAETIVKNERDSGILKFAKDTNGLLLANINTLDQINTSITGIKTSITEKKGLKGWAKDCINVVIATVVVIFIIGALGEGQKLYDALTNKTEQVTGSNRTPPPGTPSGQTAPTGTN